MMKYIRFKTRGFVLFSGDQSHEEMARAVDDAALSAGLVLWVNRGPTCCGESLTLALPADDKDTERLRATFEV